MPRTCSPSARNRKAGNGRYEVLHSVTTWAQWTPFGRLRQLGEATIDGMPLHELTEEITREARRRSPRPPRAAVQTHLPQALAIPFERRFPPPLLPLLPLPPRRRRHPPSRARSEAENRRLREPRNEKLERIAPFAPRDVPGPGGSTERNGERHPGG